MANVIRRVDPEQPSDGSTVLVFEMDSMTGTRIYAPGSTPDTPIYELTSDDAAKNVTLRRSAYSTVIGTAAYAHAFKRGAGKLGSVTLVGHEPVPIKDWLHLSGEGVEKARAQVKIRDVDYVWSSKMQGQGYRAFFYFEVSYLWIIPCVTRRINEARAVRE
jgi:hypothetical protein